MLGEEISEQLFGEGHRIQFVKIFDLKRRYTLEAFELHNYYHFKKAKIVHYPLISLSSCLCDGTSPARMHCFIWIIFLSFQQSLK